MVSIFGDKAFKGGSEKLINFTCKNCASRDATELTCYHSYYHIFFIPVVPNKRQFVTQCLKCGYIDSIEPKEDTAFQYLRKEYPNPVWMWVGLPVYTAFTAYFVYFKFLKN